MSVFALLIMTGFACSQVHAEDQAQVHAQKQTEPKLLIVGDSISAGFGIPVEEQWPLLLEQKLRDRFPQLTVVVAAISGDTTSGGRSRLPALLERHKPDVTLLALGGNDALRGTPLSLVRNNLTAMIAAAQESGSDVILAGMQIPPNYGPAYTEGFRTLYIELSGSYNTGLVPFLLEGIAAVDGMMQDDGIHPTTEAQPALADNVAPEVIKLITQP
ncbi:MAG: arylesterase [Pseudomonadota bacterium]|uniref:arylesterase n=1 Tax=Thalassolituus sp. TaxID=2030822 RepID=UPI0027D61783|nr:arylesterase [Thalassolituus sp.]MDQ4424512.1 arylesterase [Thalassolituus sp.]MDQ4425970.1 arylesterase [Thalassolituus sp.]MEE3210402.1 arylesterase [Pseudomonadota bacterium]